MTNANLLLLLLTLSLPSAAQSWPQRAGNQNASDPGRAAQPPADADMERARRRAVFKNKEEEKAADQVAATFERLRGEAKLPPLKRIRTLDTHWLCEPLRPRPYPGYEDLRDWMAERDYVTNDPTAAPDELKQIAQTRSQPHYEAKRYSVEVCQRGKKAEFKVVIAVWRSAFQTDMDRTPNCTEDVGIWPFCKGVIF